jgi:hypothetical protein
MSAKITAATPPTTPPTIAPVWFPLCGGRSVGEVVGAAFPVEVELTEVAEGYEPVYVPVGRSGGLQAIFLLSAGYSPEAGNGSLQRRLPLLTKCCLQLG